MFKTRGADAALYRDPLVKLVTMDIFLFVFFFFLSLLRGEQKGFICNGEREIGKEGSYDNEIEFIHKSLRLIPRFGGEERDARVLSRRDFKITGFHVAWRDQTS